MKFSIIIPTYNSEKYLEKCLQSIINIDYPKSEFEIIIADGGSKDKTLEIAKNFTIKIINVPNKSISQNRNLGSEKAQGEYLVFIDSDCIVSKDLLKESEELSKKYVCFGSFYKPLNEARWVAKTWLLIEGKKEGEVDWIPSGTMIIKKAIFNELNGFDESLTTGEDFDLCHRLRKKGYKIYNEPKISSIHLGQTDNLSDFFKKEMWRGNSLIKGIKNHGIIIEELPSNLITFYHFIVIILLLISFLTFNLLFIGISFLLFIGVSFMLAVRKILQTKKFIYFFNFWILFLVYQLARAISLIRYNQLKDI